MKSTKEKDDFIYEETRRLVGATFQSIAYREFLPLVLGNQLMKEFGLSTEIGKQSEYDPNMDPTSGREFATFSFRYVILDKFSIRISLIDCTLSLVTTSKYSKVHQTKSMDIS